MASRNSMLEKILEDFPNCNSSSNSIKNESRDLNDIFSCSPFQLLPHRSSSQSFGSSTTGQHGSFSNAAVSSTPASTRMNAHHLPNTSSFFSNDQLFAGSSISSAAAAGSSQTMMNNLNLQLDNHKSQNPKNNGGHYEALDEASVKGKFGWSSCKGGVQFPIILRRDDKLVPVRIVESKVSFFSKGHTWN